MIYVIGVAVVVAIYIILDTAMGAPFPNTEDNTMPLAPEGSPVLGPAEIGSVAFKAGFRDTDLIVAVAVALAESNGYVKAYNPEVKANTPPGRGSYGLWQIYRKAHPEFDSWDLYDPQVNANAAYSVYQAAGRSFHPWSTFINNLYEANLGKAQDAVNV